MTSENPAASTFSSVSAIPADDPIRTEFSVLGKEKSHATGNAEK
jgi:hypothetical protein